MTTIGITMTKNNADIIEIGINHMLTQVDHVVALDNGSYDGTRQMLESLPITVIDAPDPAYNQSKKMTELAKIAGDMGADWIVPFDSDEIWYSPFGTIKEVLEEIGLQWLVASADLYDHVTSTEDDSSEYNPVKKIGWRRNYKSSLPKVACRWRRDLVIEQGNHGASYSGGPTIKEGLLVVRHYPYRSVDQFVRKVRDGVAAYAATDLPESSGQHWKDYGRILDSMGEAGLEQVYNTWFHLDNPTTLDGVIYDPAPIVL